MSNSLLKNDALTRGLDSKVLFEKLSGRMAYYFAQEIKLNAGLTRACSLSVLYIYMRCKVLL